MVASAGNSLAKRLLLSASVASIFIMLVAGVLLSALNRRSVVQAFDERLRLYMKVLVADVAAVTDGTATDIGNLGEPQFQIPLSGWYWQISRMDGETAAPIMATSRSLSTARLGHLVSPTDAKRTSDTAEGFIEGPAQRSLRVLEQMIDLGEGQKFYIAVAGNAAEITDETRQFNLALLATFGFLLAALLISTIVQVRYGLRPLAQLSRAVTDIREGRSDRIEEAYPQEVAPLAQELNQLLDANREIIDRARMQVGNLAHALKTPISVLNNEAAQDSGPLAAKTREQTAIMKDQVQYYLDRARAAARAASVGSVTEIDPVMAGFLRTFPKIYRDRGIDFSCLGDTGQRFRGERQDFEDMVGNLIDNAGKWASSRVDIRVTALAAEGPGLPRVQITIDDDGPGLSAEQRQEVTRRGRRLDETRPGSGLGLSIVVDLTGLYHGSFVLEPSPLGGLRASVTLPAI